MTEPQTPQAPVREKPKRSPERLIAWFAVIAAVYVSFRILVVARGDSDTLRSLVQNLNIPAIFMATILPFVTMSLVLLFFLFVTSGFGHWRGAVKSRRAQDPQQVAKGQIAGAVITLVFVLILGWYSMSLKYVVFSVGAGGLLLFVYVISVISGRFKKALLLLVGLYASVVLVGGVVLLVAQTGVWLPRERLMINGSQTDIVYVLSSDSEWTKFLDAATHKVHILPTPAIQSRQTVLDNASTWSMTPSEYFARQAGR